MRYLVRGLAAPTAAGFAALARRGAVGHFCDDHIKAFEVLSIEAFDRLAAGRFARHVDLAPAPTLIDGDGGYALLSDALMLADEGATIEHGNGQ